ncbi:MAG: branched-chain amino acid aminotransferase [Rhodobacterales bacterium]|nr:branched-chain amino acid aminotransferase [Rhodobacterales bacterium]
MSLPDFADRDGAIWLDGTLVPWRQARPHVLDHGLHYGSSVMDGLRIYGGRIFRLRDHTERLLRSARVLGFDLPFPAEAIDEACRAVCAANGVTDGYIRPVAWRGSEAMGVSAKGTRPRLAIAAWEWPAYFGPEAKARGLRLDWAQWHRPAPDTAPVQAKAGGLYMIGTLSKDRALDRGYDDALMLDWRGHLGEATGANVFLVMENGSLHTPEPVGILNGLTRQTVMALARRRGIEVVERAILPDELAGAREVFLTGTAAEIMPVGAVGEDLVFTPGAVTEALMADYAAAVRTEWTGTPATAPERAA